MYSFVYCTLKKKIRTTNTPKEIYVSIWDHCMTWTKREAPIQVNHTLKNSIKKKSDSARVCLSVFDTSRHGQNFAQKFRNLEFSAWKNSKFWAFRAKFCPLASKPCLPVSKVTGKHGQNLFYSACLDIKDTIGIIWPPFTEFGGVFNHDIKDILNTCE